MSATLGVLLKELEPSLAIQMFEALEDCALESSDAWNNAGTGHAANCEMNYTPERPDGSIDISKALQVNVEFDLSRQFWSYLIKKGAIADPRSFIHPVPHMSFVHGADNVCVPQKEVQGDERRTIAMTAWNIREDRQKIAEWAPLVMEGRAGDEPVAATRIITGTDVDYGSLTHHLVRHLVSRPGCTVHYRNRVTDLVREPDGRWRVEVHDLDSGETRSVTTQVRLHRSGRRRAAAAAEIRAFRRADGYGGFPVSGIWLRCDDPEINKRHHAKVYGKAAVGSPPMSVPHLDTRVIGGQRSLLFGPYAGFSSKFLKHGSLLDLFESVRPANVEPLLSVARDNFDLTEYLIGQVLQSEGHRSGGARRIFSQREARRTGDCRSRGSAFRSSSPMSSAADCSNSAPSSSALRTIRSSRCSARRPAPPPPHSSRSACWRSASPGSSRQAPGCQS